ncbi:RNA polymerase sigma factor [Methylophilaceae bacterium]|nr:RNA polymerase sigma factor [Methylophilaceae bacterium]
MTKEKLSKRDQATEIIQLFREGDSDGAMRLFEKYGFRKEFIRFTMKSGINKEDARDLVQEFTIDKLYMQSDSIKDIEFARTWMYRVLRNMVIDKGRVLKKNREIPFDEDRDQSQAPKILEENQTRSGCVQEQLAKFREAEPKRAEVMGFIIDGLSPEEIGRIIGRPYGATREFMSQCRKKFKLFIEICNEIEE